MFGWHPIEDMIEGINNWVFELLQTSIKTFLDLMMDFFSKSVNTVQANVSQTPTEFSAVITENLRTISDTAILPVAGLILTYVFCFEIYKMIVDKNKGDDFDFEKVFYLFIKTSAMILLLTNSFDITLAVFDLGKWITDKVPDALLVLPESITDNILGGLEQGAVGQALVVLLITGIAFIITFIMSGIIYLVAWSRIITIMLYISVSPIPFSTLINRDWIGSIGQSYVKNLLALMLQGYLMLVCLVVYSGLLEKTSSLIVSEGNVFYGLMLMLVSMAILVITLTRTHSLAKSIVGVF